MPNELTKTDQFVRRSLENFHVNYEEQKSSNVDIQRALKSASKQEKKGIGKPDFIFTSGNRLLIIEDKLNTSYLIKLNEEKELDMTQHAVANYAVNGAVHYAKHIVSSSITIEEIIAIGVSGDSIYHEILPYVVTKKDDKINIRELNKVVDLVEFHPDNIDEWYNVNVLGHLSKEQKEVRVLMDVASELHEDMRNYGSLEGENKATVISGILLALKGDKNLLINMTGSQDDAARDGDKIISAINTYLNSTGVKPKDSNANWNGKINILMNKFAFIATNPYLNEPNKLIGMTPLKYFAKKLNDNVLHHLGNNTEFDILGNFYGEFVKYGGNDGNSLGIVLTPKHITSLMAELIDIQPEDKVLDPACGSGAFLISAMNRMIRLAEKDSKKIEQIKQNNLFGIELQEKLFTVATTNMILRGDGKSNLELKDMFKVSGESMKKKGITKVLFNPPYSQAKNSKTRHLSELSFIDHALDMLQKGGKLAAIVPQSTMVGKNSHDKNLKKNILSKHTLEYVITLNPNTFYGIGVNPCIAVFTANKIHPEEKQVQFFNFKDDGYIVRKHIGLESDGSEKQKRNYLLSVVKGNIIDLNNNFVVRSTITADDEWLHSYFYFDDAIPNSDIFEKTVQDYLAFKFDQTVHGRGYLFDEEIESSKKIDPTLPKLDEVEWGVILVSDIFNIFSKEKISDAKANTKSALPYISARKKNNGLKEFLPYQKNKVQKNSITWNKIGDGGAGLAYYHPYDYLVDSINVVVLYPKLKTNLYIGLFLSTLLSMYKDVFNHGHTLSKSRFNTVKIKVPVTSQQSLDLDYMEQYIVNIMKTTEVPKLEPVKSSSLDLNSVRWKEFEISQVFDQVSSVKGKTLDNYQHGKIPYVTTAATNNGVTNYVSTDEQVITSGNVITIDPIKGKTFYHAYNFVGRGGAGSAINVLESTKLNKNIGLFITTMIESNSLLRASYGSQLNGKRLKKLKIMLPIVDENTPNWQFMEEYIKSISNADLL